MLFYMVSQDSRPTKPARQVKIDESIIEQVGRENKKAFEELYINTERAVYSYVLGLLKNPDDTLDVVQDTYLKIRASAHLYKRQGKPMAWIFTIARNLCMDLLRQRTRTTDYDNSEMENNISFSYVNDNSDKLVLAAAFKILADDERQIVMLHAVSGMKHREIAKSLDLPLSTALSRYNRAIKKLKKHLSEQGVSM